MVLWILTLVSVLIIPIVMIGCGGIFKKYPPKTINNFYGYRTPMSSKNQETWDFAQTYFGKVWWKIGWIMCLGVILIMVGILLSGYSKNEAFVTYSITIITIIEVVLMVLSIIPVEKALRRVFNKDGTKK